MNDPRQLSHDAPLLRLHIEGGDELGGDVRLGAFIEKLTALRAALAETDHLIHGGERATTDFLVEELRHNSPAMIGLRPIAVGGATEGPREVVNEFVSFLRNVRNNAVHDVSSRNAKLVKHLRDLVSGVGKRFERIWIDGPHIETIPLDETVAAALGAALPHVRHEKGSVKGVVKRYSSLGKTRYFKIVPPAGGVEIKCVFSEELIDEAAQSVEQNATIEGELRTYEGDFWPHEVHVTRITVHDKDIDLPSLRSMTGVAPEATGDESAAEFVRRLRNEW